MLVLARILWLATRAPERLVAHRADVQYTTGGFTWHVRGRSPAFQRAITLLVETSTEGLALAWLLALFNGGIVGPWVDALLPAWLLVQAIAVALVLTWERRGTASVRRVELRRGDLAVGRQIVPLDGVQAVQVSSAGWGPWRTASLTVVPRHGTPLPISADGDDDASLHGLAAHIDRARVRATRRVG